MRAVALGLLGLLGLLGCQRAPYDLDMPIAIETDSLAALAALRAGIAELGGHVTDSAGQKVQVSSVCRCALDNRDLLYAIPAV